jgi:hypothetical protein
MNDYSGILNGGKHHEGDVPSQKQTLINDEHPQITEEEAKKQLVKILHISALIEEVYLFPFINLYYIGSYYLLKIRISLSWNIYYWFLYHPRMHC